MAEYIDRKDIFPNGVFFASEENPLASLDKLIERIWSIPAANVAPVRHGRWVHLGGDEWCCSCCGEVISTEGSWEKPMKKFCNECGCKMDLEE